MGIDASHIDWDQVWLDRAVAREKWRLQREHLTEEEMQRVKDSTGCDPCDDCCCGACGRRKTYPGDVCC